MVHLDVTPPSPTVTGRQIRGRVTTAIVGTLQQVILSIVCIWIDEELVKVFKLVLLWSRVVQIKTLVI